MAGLSAILSGPCFITEEGTTGNPSASSAQLDHRPLGRHANYVHGLPVYCVSVGLALAKEPLLGVTYEPNRDELFSGWQGDGAWCNRERLQVTMSGKLGESLLAMGFPYYIFDKHERYLKILETLMRQTHGLGRLGAAAAHVAYVAAGVLLIKEAGGIVTDFLGGDN